MVSSMDHDWDSEASNTGGGAHQGCGAHTLGTGDSEEAGPAESVASIESELPHFELKSAFQLSLVPTGDCSFSIKGAL